MSRQSLETRSGGAVPLCKKSGRAWPLVKRRAVRPSSSGYVSVFEQDSSFPSAGVARRRRFFRITLGPRCPRLQRSTVVLSFADSQSHATMRLHHERLTPRHPSLTRRISDGRSCSMAMSPGAATCFLAHVQIDQY